MPVINRLPILMAEKFGGQENISLSEIQRETGLNYVTVSRWVKGQIDRADFDTLAIWCKYLGVGVGDILEYTDES